MENKEPVEILDWINQSIIQEAKILLKHSDLLVYQISDELNFPNPSFFCKFFKRMTEITPQEYQKKQYVSQHLFHTLHQCSYSNFFSSENFLYICATV